MIEPMADKGKIEIKHAGKIYEPSGIHVVAVDDCSFDIQAGEFVSVVGPSGCGKSTLLNTIAGFDYLTSGEILLDGELMANPCIHLPPGPDRVVVFQGGALFPWKTTLENIIYGPVTQGLMSKEDAKKLAVTMLHKVGLLDVEEKYPSEISSGVQRRVEILRAMINSPSVVLLDEPFRALDEVAKNVMHNFLLEIYDDNPRTMFFITHDLDEAIYLSDRIVVMTTRPAKIKKIIPIDVPRPRNMKIAGTEEYRKLKEELLAAVHEEAIKAFKAGEREMA